MGAKFSIGEEVKIARRPDGRLPLSRQPSRARIGRRVKIKDIIPAPHLGEGHLGYVVSGRSGQPDVVYASYELAPIWHPCLYCTNSTERNKFCCDRCRLSYHQREWRHRRAADTVHSS